MKGAIKINDITNSAKGYIVFEDGGINPIEYGASEKWFPTYDKAISYAIELVSTRTKELKSHVCANSVIVYEAEEPTLRESHSVPCGRVVFQWSNYKK